MESTPAEATKIPDPDAWVSQTVLGEQFGWTSVDTGHCLELMSWRVNRLPTAGAERQGLARTEHRKDSRGSAYLHALWHHDKVSALIAEYAHAEGGFRNLTARLQLKHPQTSLRQDPMAQILSQLNGMPADIDPEHVRRLFSLIAALDERVSAAEGRASALEERVAALEGRPGAD